MKKLNKFLIMTVLVAMLVGLGAIASSAAATAAPARVIYENDGSVAISSTTSGTQKQTSSIVTKSGNNYFSIEFIDTGANANFGSGNKGFIGQGDYVITEYDFMAEDWTKVKSILIGWNSRNSSGGALNDMHFTYSNENGAPKITAGPLTGSITLDPAPGVWHHFTLVVKIGGEHKQVKNDGLTAVQGQDAVEAYAYIDGQLFATNLIGDGKEFWSKDTTYYQSLRLTASGGGQQICIDNVRVVQYNETRELREFFKYREKNGGQFPDLNAVDYPFLAYDAEYDYPIGTPVCKVVELSGNETLFDRFDKACKYAAARSGAKVVLLTDIASATVSYPVKIDRAGFNLNYTMSPALRAEEQERVNPITGETSNEISFIKKTKYAFYKWAVDHTGEAFDSRGYAPLAVGTPIVYDGSEFKAEYYRDGVLYTFNGTWTLDGAPLAEVPAYAANSFYTLYPVITAADVYAIFEDAEGETKYALSAADVATLAAAATQDTVVTFIKDVALDAPLVVNNRVVLDLAGKALKVSGSNAFRLAEGARGTVITSSVEGAAVTADGAVLDVACGFTYDGANIKASAAALINVDAAVSGVVIDGGVFALSGDCVLLIGAEASLDADIHATVIADAYLADPALTYNVTLGGAFAGVLILDSEVSTVVLSEGLALDYFSSFVDDALPLGVTLADEALVIAAKKTVLDGAVAAYAVMDKADAVLLNWEEGVAEYVAPGETVYYGYSDYYDAKLFYRHSTNGTYAFSGEGVAANGNVLGDWAGLEIAVDPFYDSMSFYIVAVTPDYTFVPYTEPASLTALMMSGEYEDGTLFAIGKKNAISIENLTLTNEYYLDLNGYAIQVLGLNEINGGSLAIISSVEGASIYSGAVQAFSLKNAALVIDGENIAYYGKTLALVDPDSALLVLGGVYVVTEGDFYKAEAGAIVMVDGIAANAELFEAEEGYAWKAVSETVVIGGITCDIVAVYEMVE